jgi:hypothetical protein
MILKLIQMQFQDFYDIIFFSANIFFSLERVFSRICHFHPLLIFLGPTSIFFMEQNKMRLSLCVYDSICIRISTRK